MPKPEQLLRKVFPPMLATLADAPPRDRKIWSYELKYDGFRALTAIAGGQVAMWSRNELDLAPRFPLIAAAMQKIKAKEVVLDGEIVALDEKGAARFQLLQQGQRQRIFIFDVLWLDGKDLRKLTYLERRAILKKVLKGAPAAVKLSEVFDMEGDAALKQSKDAGIEGIIAKKNSSCYEPRRSKEWLKIKSLNEQELIVIGFHPSTHSSKEIGSLHLAVKGDDGELHYAGKVGTGFSFKQRTWFKDELSKDVVPQSPAKDAPRERAATWVRPRFVVQVAFTEWTGDNRLRHPAFLGIREDKGVSEVVREKPISASGVQRAASSKKETQDSALSTQHSGLVTLTNPDRVLYPRDKITKQDLVSYYQAVAEPMIRALRDRPLALEHWNQGISKPSWFHQDVGKGAPDWVTTIDTPTRTTKHPFVTHLVVDKPETLRWLAQMSVLTVHMWASRGENLDQPDWLVFDLDPAKGKGIAQAIEAAIIMRGLLENLRLPSVPKTSGKRGIHVFVPLVAGYTHEQAAEFACSIAAAVAAKVPTITVERSLAQRKGRLYLDCMQNAYGKTVVAPYSPRAIDGAPVSAPLEWSEITKKLDPLKYNMRTMPDRLAKKGDLFARVFKERARLPALE
jgi:bifunctional non-homologous end joining protein LigD